MTAKDVTFENRVRKNFRRLKSLRKRTEAYRLYDEDIPELPFVIEVYGKTLVFTHVVHRHAAQDQRARNEHLSLAQRAAEVAGIAPDAVVIKERARRVKGEVHQRRDYTDARQVVVENGLRFEVNVTDYLDTGLFLDHRPWRTALLKQSPNCVLNLFAYTCSLSVAAAAGGARRVDSVDLSGGYLSWGRENLDNNRAHRGGVIPDDIRCNFIEGDARAFLDEADTDYDLILVDPPTLSQSPRADDFEIQRDHVSLLRRAQAQLSRGGELWFSTNARQFEWALDETWVETTAQSVPADFRGTPHRSWRFRDGG